MPLRDTQDEFALGIQRGADNAPSRSPSSSSPVSHRIGGTLGTSYHFAKAGGFLLAMSFPLLLREPPLQVLPSLACAIGLNEAIALQQLYYLQSNPQNGKTLADGERYIFNTYAEWSAYFPFWSEPTIKRVFLELEQRHLVETQQPEGNFSRRKYYRVPLSVVVNLTHERMQENRPDPPTPERIKLIPSTDEIVRRTDQIDPSNGSNPSVPLIAETTPKTTTTGGPDEIIYSAYPKKVGRQDALKAIRNALKAVAFERLLEMTQAYAAAMALWTEDERKFIPHPSTWFNHGRYDDDQSTWKRKSNAPNRPINQRSFEMCGDYSGVLGKTSDGVVTKT